VVGYGASELVSPPGGGSGRRIRAVSVSRRERGAPWGASLLPRKLEIAKQRSGGTNLD